MSQRYRVPMGVLVAGLVGFVALVTVDLTLMFDDPAPLRADLRLLLSMATSATATWLALRIARSWFDQMERRLDRIERSTSEMPTVPLRQFVAVAHAQVPAPPMPRIDPDVIDIARRLEGKVTRGLDQ